jgi:tetratricopeptide (TPR) repeat protein
MRLFPAAAAALLIAASAHAESDTPAPPAAPAPAAAAPASASGAPAAAAAAPSAHLAAAQRLYQKLEFDAALPELQQAEAGAKENEDEMAQVLIYRGLVYSQTGKGADASEQFKRALAIRPWAELPADTSPRTAKIFSEARKSIWGMASVKPPEKKAAANPAPATTPPTPAAQPAPAPGK